MHFFRDCIRREYLVLLFGLHVAAGCMHNWIAFHFYPHHGDIWFFFDESIVMKQRLLSDPKGFFSGIFAGGEFNITDSGKPILDVQYKVIQYVNLLLNLLSVNNLYVNTLLFSFPVFAGTMALFKVFYAAFKNPLSACCTLLLPSVLFWCSVLYKDSLFYMAAGYFFYYLLHTGKSLITKAFILPACVAVIVLTRANALITLLPAMCFLFLTEKKSVGKAKALGLTLLTVTAAAIIFHLFTDKGILTIVFERQRDFQALTGGSRIYLPELLPTAGSFLAVFPVALVNGFFQPLPGVGGKSIYMAFSVELLLIWAIVLFACRLLMKKKIMPGNFDIACLLFALPGLVIIGYMIPFAGAIIRYRSIYLPFLLAPFLTVICRYPAAPAQFINAWLYRNVMAPEIKKR